MTNLHGDSVEYLNYFADKRPIAYFGFSSFSKLINYVENIPEEIANDDRNDCNQGWRTWPDGWAGTADMSEALDLARNGWPEGASVAREIMALLTAPNALQRRRKYSMSGGRVNVGRMLSGNPLHMISRPRQPGKKIIKLFVETSFPHTITVENAIVRAAVIGAMVQILETNGHSCEIIGVGTNTFRKDPSYQIIVNLKKSGEKLNINDLIFTLGHPSFFRRLMFAITATDRQLKNVWSSMGISTPAFTERNPTKPNELHVLKLHNKLQKYVDKTTFETHAISMFNLIVPIDFPVEISV